MAVPSGDLGDLLVADWAESSLFFPEGMQPVFPFEGCCHLNVEAFFKVAFPCRVIRVGFPLNFHVSSDRHVRSTCEVMRLLINSAEKDPVVSLDGGEVFLRFPCFRFSSVSSVHPSPDGLIDHCINGTKGFFADDMPMIGRPTSNDRVEFRDQFPGRQGFVCLHDLPNFLKECFHILLGWANKQLVPFSHLVLAYVLAQEIKPILDMRDEGLLWRELETPFSQELFNKRLNFLFQKFFRSPSHQKVVCISYEVHKCSLSGFDLGEVVHQHPFKTVQRHIREYR